MIKNGVYVVIKGTEYRYTKDMRTGEHRIISLEKECPDSTFEDLYGTGVYSRVIHNSEIDQMYNYTTTGLVKGVSVALVAENESQYCICTTDGEIAKRYGLEPYEQKSYSGWIDKKDVKVICRIDGM